MRRMCRQVAHRPMREGWDSWAFAIERIEIISQKCTAALESCLFHDFVSGGLCSCASFMTRHSTDVSCSLVISLSGDRKSTRLNSSHTVISYAVFCLKKKIEYNNLFLFVLKKNTDI